MMLDAMVGQAAGVRGLGSLGRGARRLRRVMRRLESLMLGLDRSRIDAVAVLGAGPAGTPAEAGQRLYESALLAAWREAEALGSLPLGVQRRPDTVRRAESLRDRVADLARQDEDVRRRAERFLGA